MTYRRNWTQEISKLRKLQKKKKALLQALCPKILTQICSLCFSIEPPKIRRKGQTLNFSFWGALICGTPKLHMKKSRTFFRGAHGMTDWMPAGHGISHSSLRVVHLLCRKCTLSVLAVPQNRALTLPKGPPTNYNHTFGCYTCLKVYLF